MGLENAVDFEWELWQCVGMWFVVVGWNMAGQLFAAVGQFSLGMWPG